MFRKLSIGLVLALAACGSAKVIQRTQTGGVIQLDGDRGKAMEQANGEMSRHCGPGNYTITQEGEEAVGTDTFVREDTATDSATSRSGRRSSTDTTRRPAEHAYRHRVARALRLQRRRWSTARW